MKVNCATQVFSKSVAVAMGYLAEKEILPEEATATVEVVIFSDDLFDSINGSYENSQKRSGKLLFHSVTPNSTHFKVWKEAKSIMKTMKFVTKDGKTYVVPSITNWITSLENIEYLTNKLFQQHNCKSLWLRHLNQDPLEKFFWLYS
ncbi:unnamed protein product [Euphydryas editha]|uniref:Transposable element P transposase-like GTP-binding insertion domain-containing protein n=1 Tax=Euphydryas editha TaxID=104508 RepID=A0AAU9UP87_EUPED|nr:unnamed protein product [Euphydryas editha]